MIKTRLVYIVPVCISAFGALLSTFGLQWIFVVCVALNCIAYSIWFVVQSLLETQFRLRNIIFMLAVHLISCLISCIPVFISYTWEEFQTGDAGMILMVMLILSMSVTGIGGLLVWLLRKIKNR